jgi:hypothetical protein
MSNLLIFPLIERAKRASNKHTVVVCFPKSRSARKTLLSKLRDREAADEVTRASR